MTVHTTDDEPRRRSAQRRTCIGFTHTEAKPYFFASSQIFRTSSMEAFGFRMVWSMYLAIDAALFSTFVIGTVNLLFTFVSFWVIDRYGRKVVYTTGSFGMTAVLVVLAALAALGHFQGGLVLGLLLAYVAFFASCIGPVFWTLVPEIFPNRVRGVAMSVPVLTQWIANAIMVLFFPSAFNQIGKAPTIAFLAIMALTQVIFTWIMVPETKGRSLEEIEALWQPAEGVAKGGVLGRPENLG